MNTINKYCMMSMQQSQQLVFDQQQHTLENSGHEDMTLCNEEDSSSSSSCSSQTTIKLNVGGRLFEISHDTILAYPNSMLAKLVLNRDSFKKEEEYYIDRSPKLFEYIVNFMRNHRTYVMSEYSYKTQMLRDEAKFYNLYDDMFPSKQVARGPGSNCCSEDVNDIDNIVQEDEIVRFRKEEREQCNNHSSRLFCLTSHHRNEIIELLAFRGKGILEMDGVVVWDSRLVKHMDSENQKKHWDESTSQIHKDLCGIVIPSGKCRKISIKALGTAPAILIYQRVFTFFRSEQL